jgi:hypothetical protein
MSDQEAFEAWAESRCMDVRQSHMHSWYECHETNMAYEGWQASTQHHQFRITELEAAVQALRKITQPVALTPEGQAIADADVAEAERQWAATVADAKRYRWLRSKSRKCMDRAWIGSAVVKTESGSDFFSFDEAIEAIEAAIDSAIAAAPQPTGGA